MSGAREMRNRHIQLFDIILRMTDLCLLLGRGIRSAQSGKAAGLSSRIPKAKSDHILWLVPLIHSQPSSMSTQLLQDRNWMIVSSRTAIASMWKYVL